MAATSSGAARISLFIVTGLVIFKVLAGSVTGSVSIFAQALDSLLDVFAATTTFFAIRAATKPADREHPFGHGKLEGVAAAGQAVLLFTASGIIIYSSVQRIFNGEKLEEAGAGIAVMLLSLLVSIFLSRYLLRTSRVTGSMALEASAHNIAADVYTTAGVLIGLVVIYFTDLTIIDPIIAIIVASLIVRAAYGVMRKSISELIDIKLPEAEENIIRQSVLEHVGELVNYHELRTRKAGKQRYIDLHIVMPKNLTIEESHRLCDHLEQDIKNKLQNASVTIHVEPCTEECDRCPITPGQHQKKR